MTTIYLLKILDDGFMNYKTYFLNIAYLLTDLEPSSLLFCTESVYKTDFINS